VCVCIFPTRIYSRKYTHIHTHTGDEDGHGTSKHPTNRRAQVPGPLFVWVCQRDRSSERLRRPLMMRDRQRDREGERLRRLLMCVHARNAHTHTHILIDQRKPRTYIYIHMRKPYVYVYIHSNTRQIGVCCIYIYMSSLFLDTCSVYA